MIYPSSPRSRVARAIGLSLLSLSLTDVAVVSAADDVDAGEAPVDVHVATERQSTGPFSFSVRPDLPEASQHPFPLRVGWQLRLPGREVYAFQQAERSTPRVLGNEVLVGSSRAPDILVLDPRSGWIKRKLETRGPVQAPVLVEPAGGDLFVGDTAGFFYRFRQDGTRVWEYESTGPVTSAAAIAGGRVFFHAIDGALIALDATTGKQQWSYRREAVVAEGLAVFGASVPLVTPEGLVITGFEDGTVAALKAVDGAPAWEVRLVSDGRWLDVDGDPVLLDGDRVFISAYGGPAVCLRATTGEELWRVPVGGAGRPLYRDNTLYLPDSNGSIIALSASTGERLWRWKLPQAGTPNSPVWWRGTLAITSSAGQLYLLDPRGKLLWQWEPETLVTGFASEVTAGDAALYALSNGGRIYQLIAPDYQAVPVPTQRQRWRWPGE